MPKKEEKPDIPVNPPKQDKQEELDKQITRGQLNTNNTLTRLSEKVNELEAYVFGINDALLEKGLLPPRFLFKKIDTVKQAMMDEGTTMSSGTELRVDSGTLEINSVNCLERLHVCKAICCKLSFPLSDREVEGGHVKWDLGKPYYIRQKTDGYCCSKGAEGTCNIYENRPNVCLSFSCKEDQRIWKDFDKMEINEEWINDNLTGGYPK